MKADITFELTEKQIEKIKDILLKTERLDKPGLLLAQIVTTGDNSVIALASMLDHNSSMRLLKEFSPEEYLKRVLQGEVDQDNSDLFSYLYELEEKMSNDFRKDYINNLRNILLRFDMDHRDGIGVTEFDFIHASISQRIRAYLFTMENKNEPKLG